VFLLIVSNISLFVTILEKVRETIAYLAGLEYHYTGKII